MTLRRKTFEALSLLAVAALALGACAAPPPAEPDAPDKVVLGLARILSALPYFIADAEGYFAEQNIEIEFVDIVSSTDVMAPLSTGDLDAATLGLSTALFTLMANDPDIRAVVDRGVVDPTQCQAQAVLIRRELLTNGALDTAESVRALNVSIISAGPAAFAFDQWLDQNYGLGIEVMNTNTLPPAALLDALNNGAIDLVATQEPNVTFLLQNTDTEVLLTYSPSLDNVSYAFMVYSGRLLNDDPDLGRRFMVAYLKGVQGYLEGPTERNLALAAEYLGQDPELLKQACWSTMRPDGRIDFAASIPYMQWELEAGRLERLLTEDEYWDPLFIEYAYDQLEN